MNRILLTTSVVLLILVSAFAVAEERTVVLNVEKMHCALCPVTVRKAIEKVDGVKDVVVDFERKTATVIYDDDATTVERIADASTNVGYPAAPSRE